MTAAKADTPQGPGSLPPRPRILDVAVWTYIATAILNVAVGAWTLSFIPRAIDQIHASGKTVNQSGETVAFALIAVATLIFSAAIVFLALRVRRGNTWARPSLLTVSLLSLVALLTGGGPGLAIIILLACAAVLVTRRPVTAWVRAAQGLPPA